MGSFLREYPKSELIQNKNAILLCSASKESILNATAFKKAKIVYNFGLSECNRVQRKTSFLLKPILSFKSKCLLKRALHSTGREQGVKKVVLHGENGRKTWRCSQCGQTFQTNWKDPI